MKSVCVFAGSSSAVNPEYFKATEELAIILAQQGYDLVYGGGSGGLMGVIANTFHKNGRRVLGIIPEALIDVSGVTPGGEQISVKSMHERKHLMNQHCSAFVALPGGFGTMEELMEMITWSQLQIHQKPVVVLNTLGFYDHLKAWILKAINEKFIKVENFVAFCDHPKDVLEAFTNFKPPNNVYGLDWNPELNKEDLE